MSSFPQGVVSRRDFIMLAAELASPHLYKRPEMELSTPDCRRHDDRLEMSATWKHLISYQVCCHDCLQWGMYLAKLQTRIYVFYSGY